MAFQNLKAELVKEGITQKTVAEFLSMTAQNFNRKLAEAIPTTRDEMYAIRDRFFPKRSIDYLFESDGDVPTKAESLHAQADAIADAMRQAAPDDPEVEEIGSTLHEAVNEWERNASDEAAKVN